MMKHFENLRAEFALRGYAVHRVDTGFIVTRWGLSKHCPDLDALGAFLRQIGGQPC